MSWFAAVAVSRRAASSLFPCGRRPGSRLARRIAWLAAISLALGAAAFPAESEGVEYERAVARARTLADAGKLEEAVEIYRELLAGRPDDARLLLHLAAARFKATDYAEAIRLCRRIVQANPRAAPAWFFLGASHFQLDQFEAAIEPLSKAVAARPGERDARLMLAESLLLAGRQREARSQFEAAKALLPGNPRVWYGLNRVYVQLGAVAAARLASEFPASPAARVQFGAERTEAGDPSAAVRSLRAALDRPDIGPALRRRASKLLASAYRQSGQAQEARAIEAALEASPQLECGTDSTDAACLFRGGRFDEVLREMGTIRTAQALYWRVQACAELAERASQRLQALPDSPQRRELQARTYARRGNHRAASAAWRDALALDPRNRVLRLGLAAALFELRDYTAALPLLDAVLAEGPEDPDARFMRGSAYLHLHRVRAAIPDLVRAVELRDDFAHARAELSRAYLLAGSPELAIPVLKKILPRDEDGSYRYRLARAYQLTGQAALAERALRDYRRFTQGLAEERAAAR